MVGVSEISAGVGGRGKRLDVIDLSDRCILYCFRSVVHRTLYCVTISTVSNRTMSPLECVLNNLIPWIGNMEGKIPWRHLKFFVATNLIFQEDIFS